MRSALAEAHGFSGQLEEARARGAAAIKVRVPPGTNYSREENSQEGV